MEDDQQKCINQLSESDNKQKIIQIAACQCQCSDSRFRQAGALHCYLICTLVERGLSILFNYPQQKYLNGSLIGRKILKKPKSVSDLYHELQSSFTQYDQYNNNCYHFCAQVCSILDAPDQKTKIICALLLTEGKVLCKAFMKVVIKSRNQKK